MGMTLSAPPVALRGFRLNLRPLVPWIVPAAAILLWQVACDAGWIGRRTLPSPFGIANAAVALEGSGHGGPFGDADADMASNNSGFRRAAGESRAAVRP